MVLKLAVIYEVSESCTLVVSERAMHRAIEVARSVERTVFEILPTGMTREGSEIEKIAELVLDAQIAGVSQSRVTLAFKHWKGMDRKQRLETLKEAGTIVGFSRETVGRPATILVHTDYADEHSSKFPQDKRQ
jgi:hypothetical protein